MKIPLKMDMLMFLALLSTSAAWAWGGRGHHSVCSAAVFLVKDEGLKSFLKSRPQMMGHLCNVPDFYWKGLGPEVSKLGNPAHYIDVEITGLKIKDVPTDYQKIVTRFTGKPNEFKKDKTIFSVPTEFGSLWWRADQFMRRAVETGKVWKSAKAPTNSKEEQDENLPYNKASYDFIVNLGLMGHFVGDASQPFHATVDYDGYLAGHGGIHAFYEDTGVSALGPKLELKVVEAAQKLQELLKSKSKQAENLKKISFLKEKTVVEKMRALSEISLTEVGAILAADPIKKPSTIKNEKGMEIKTAAEREDISKAVDKFEPLIVQQMARSAALLAQLWDEAYEKVGRPKLAAYKSYKYPFTPEFVVPDYFEEPKK